MSSGQADLQAAFQSLVHGEQCYYWRSVIRRQDDGGFDWDFPEFDLEAAQRFLTLPADTHAEYLRQEQAHADPGDWERCRRNNEEALRSGQRTVQQEYRIRDTRGRQRVTRDLIHLEVLEDGVWQVIGLCFDVTESRIRERLQTGQNQVLERIAAGRPYTETLQELCLLLQDALGEGFAGVGNFDPELNRIVEFIAPSMSERHRKVLTRMRLELPDALKMTRQVLIVEDVRTDPEWADYRFLYRASGCPAAWTHPVRDIQGKLSGFIGVCLTSPRIPTEAELQALQAAAQIAGVALEREAVERRRADSEKTVMDVLRGVRCLLWHVRVRRETESGEFQFFDLKLPQQDIGLRFLELDATDPNDLFVRIHKDIASEDNTRMRANHIACFEYGRSGYQNEFRCRDGQGRLRWLREDVRVEATDQGSWLLVGITTDVTAQRQAEEDVRWQALHDPLTGLPNRVLLQRTLEDTLAVARSDRRRCGVIFLDLDRFKQVNDKLGHEFGDRLLCEVASRLRGAIRESDMVARISGDEFIVFLSQGGEQEARRVAERIHEGLSRPCVLGPHELRIGGSIGVALYPRDGKSAEALLRNADMAMYRAKERRDGAVSFYSSDMGSDTNQLLRETELRRALERGEFYLEYQPQIDTSEKEMLTVEALVRWRHPERGVVGPAEFIPLAEETGLILGLGIWVLREACQQASDWQSQGLPLRVSVNLSARQFSTVDLVKDVAGILKSTKLYPERLDLEITETAILQGGDKAHANLEGLRALGVRLMIDDFGTGYSSLSSLRSHPVDVVKIDRSFVMGMMDSTEDAAIVRAVVELARALDLGVIAEGVETEAHRAALENLGCTLMQGYLFSHPIAPEGVPALLESLPQQRKNLKKAA